TKEPFRIGGGNGAEGRFHGLIGEVQIYEGVLSEAEARILATAETIGDLRAIPADRRTLAQAAKLRACFLERAAPQSTRDARQRVEALREEVARLNEGFPTTMVMREMPVPRDTFVLFRGEYNKPGEKVSPGVPSILPALPEGATNDRLGL